MTKQTELSKSKQYKVILYVLSSSYEKFPWIWRHLTEPYYQLKINKRLIILNFDEFLEILRFFSHKNRIPTFIFDDIVDFMVSMDAPQWDTPSITVFSVTDYSFHCYKSLFLQNSHFRWIF